VATLQRGYWEAVRALLRLTSAARA
jgi:hypothetical protein